jgi:hypothetical protein
MRARPGPAIRVRIIVVPLFFGALAQVAFVAKPTPDGQRNLWKTVLAVSEYWEQVKRLMLLCPTPQFRLDVGPALVLGERSRRPRRRVRRVGLDRRRRVAARTEASDAIETGVRRTSTPTQSPQAARVGQYGRQVRRGYAGGVR